MIIRFTDKLAKKMNLGEITKVDKDPGPFLDWYATVFVANRLQYILTTNASSLLSVVMHGRGIVDDNMFLNRFFHNLGEYLHDIGSGFVFDRILAPGSSIVILSKTINRSVLGSMNEIVAQSKIMLEDDDVSPWELTETINDIPFKAISYRSPVEAFKSLRIVQ